MVPSSCPPPEEIEKHVSGTRSSQLVAAHLEGCGSCRVAADRLRETSLLVGALLQRRDLFSDGAAPFHGIPGYPIVAEIHRGGQGIVFEAIQESTQRHVAVKVMHQGAFADPSDRARFEREVRILGQLKHPNIVAIHDSGVIDERPYFVMDLIPGEPLDRWVETRRGRVSTSELLRLFQAICEAVNFAQLRGVIHRDLKPGNIRVDPAGQPHILDFGLAKTLGRDNLLGPQVDGMTLSGQFVGSIPWASPEQARLDSAQLDLRTDVYSLGVIFFQLLTGEFPYDVGGPVRTVLDRIATVEPIRPRSLVPQIDDELETIVLRCLSKDRERRYQSAGELARDVGRYLAGEPIEAKRDSVGYVLRKQLARHKLPVAIIGAFVLTVTTGFFVAMSLWRSAAAGRAAAVEERGKAERATIEARNEAEKARELNSFLSSLLLKADPIRQGRGDVTVREVLDEFEAKLDAGALDAQPETVAGLRQFLGGVYAALGAITAAERELRTALAARLELHGPAHLNSAESQNALGEFLLRRQQWAEAETLLNAAAATLRTLGPDQADALGTVLLNLAVAREAQRDSEQAERLYREALDLATDVEHETIIKLQLAGLLRRSGRLAAATPLYREVLAYRREELGNAHPEVATALNDFSLLLQGQGELDEAQRCIDEAVSIWRGVFPDGHLVLAVGLNTLGLLRHARGDFAGSEAAHRESLEMLRRFSPPDDARVLTALGHLVTCLKSAGKLPEAEDFLLDGLATMRKSTAPNEPQFALLLFSYGDLLLLLKRPAEAEAAFDECLAIRQRIMPDRWEPHHTGAGLARALAAQGLYAEAEPLFLEAIAGLQAHPPDRPDRFSAALNGLIELYELWGKPEQAAQWRAKLTEWRASTQPASSSQ